MAEEVAPGIFRTPEARFEGLQDYPFKSHYRQIGRYRVHYLDEGAPDGETLLLLHGEPTWSYLYRKMIPVFAAAGHRVVAPDMYGFGRSDKPEDDETYTFDFHRRSLMAFGERLDLRNITLVCQDWGGLLGLTLPMDMPGRFTRLILMNTTLGTGDVKLSEGVLAWRAWCNENPDMEIGNLMGRACPHLTDREKAAYDAPFPDVSYKAGVRRFPNLVPDHPEAPGAGVSQRARAWLQEDWNGVSFMAIGMQDPVLGPPVMHALRKRIRGCPEPLEVREAGHFVQEWGDRVAGKALEAFA